MSSDGAIPTEPSVRWILAPAFRRAVTDLWGEAGRERGMAQPAPIVARLPGFWKQDNIGGTLEATLDEGGLGATIHVTGSPFVEMPHGRASVAEVYRHAFSQTRAKNVTEVHALDGPNRMVIHLKWNA